MGGPDLTPPYIEPVHLIKLGVEAGSRQPEHRAAFAKLVDDISHRYPVVRDWIMHNPKPKLRIIHNNPHMGGVSELGVKTGAAMRSTIDLGVRLSRQKISARDTIDAIRNTTDEAEKQIAHYIVLSTILNLAGDESDEPKLRQILAKTLANSEEMYEKGLKDNPNYSPITQATKISEHLRRSTVDALPQDLENIGARQRGFEAAYSRTKNENYLPVIEMFKQIQSGSYVDAAKALLYFPNAMIKVKKVL